MKIPENVTTILQRLDGSGFKSYIVGGCVRDSIMDKHPKDWDIATSAKPEEVKVLFAKTYDTGLKHGTVTVALNEQRYEVTTFRIEGEYKDYRRPENVIFSASIEEDLKRRDFTINAIAWNASEGFVDPFNGIADISKKLVRGVGNPSDRFREDALRMLRAVRFAANLRFDIERETAEAIIANSALIKNISAERIREELLGLLEAPNPDTIFSKEFISLIEHISQPLAKSIVLNSESMERLLIDCKKSEAIRFVVLIYYLGCEDAELLLKKLKFSNSMRDRILAVHKVRNQRIGCEYYDVVKKISEWGLQTFEDYLYLQMLNCIANDADLDYTMQVEEQYRQVIDNKYPVFIKDLAINGYDLNMEFNVTGKTVGKIFEGLLDYVHRNPNNNTYEALLKEGYALITKSN